MTLSRQKEPQVSPMWMRWFSAYAERYVRKNFHSVRILNSPRPVSTQPLVVYLNHASWWDPMICVIARNRFFAQRTSYAPIDARALEKYKFFRKLGFFPVSPETRRGAADFLSGASAAMAGENCALWVTPQGRFTDVRERPVELRGGIAHLASMVNAVTYVPLAIEYTFWQERLPEVCLNFGDPVAVTRNEAEKLGPKRLTRELSLRLESAQDELAAKVVARDENALRVLSKNTSGVGGVYDTWRRVRTVLRGETFQAEHAIK